MTRILYITKSKLSFSRAYTQNILNTASSLADQGTMQVTVFSSAQNDESAKEILDHKKLKFNFDLDVHDRSRSLVAFVWKARSEFEILYFRDPLLFLIAFWCRFLLGKKVIFEAHGSHEWPFVQPIWRLAILAANGVVYITERLRKYYGIKKPSIVVHTNGINVDLFRLTQDPKMLRRSLLLPIDKIIILYIGSFLWYSAETIVRMMKYLPDTLVLVIVGLKNEELKKLERLVAEESVSERVLCRRRVLPPVIPEYLLAADILVNPLVIDYPGSISSKLYEYLAAGKPIVSSQGGANDEIIRDGENGLLVSLTSKDFADAILRIINDRSFADTLARNAQADAQNYTWGKRAERIGGLLDQISL